MRPLSRISLIMILLLTSFPVIGGTARSIEVPLGRHARTAVLTPEVQELPFEVTHLGVSWKGGEEQAPRVRFGTTPSSMGPWVQVEPWHDMEDPDTGTSYSALIDAPGARSIQVEPKPGTREVRISSIDTEGGPSKKVVVRAAAGAATPQPDVVSRAEWGADESIRSWAPEFRRVRRLFVHHTVTPNGETGSAATSRMRAIYRYHTLTRGWGDIGYNFVIDAGGVVYEGRYSRQYAAGEEPTGEDLNGMGVVGAHVLGHNYGSVGVALLGDFTNVGPAAAAQGTLVNLWAWKVDRNGIDPFGSAGGIPNLAGHRDGQATACPGNQLYPRLPSIRNDVEDRILTTTHLSAPSMPAGTELFPPGVSHDLTPLASGGVSRGTVKVTLTFKGSEPGNLRIFILTPADGSYRLTETDYLGIPLKPDDYRVTAVAEDAQGRSSPEALVAAKYLVTEGDIATGYWVLGQDGGIFSFGSAAFHGSLGDKKLNGPVLEMAATSTGKGYWIVASDGGIFAFGDAKFYGSTGAMKLNKPVVGMASTPSGKGYWLVASDGGIFAFGDAKFYGSTGSIKLNKPVVGMAATPSGKGYWLVASDGGIFAFGDAKFYGSTGAMKLNKPIVSMEASPTGKGYWLLASDGGIFTYGDAQFRGSLPARGIEAEATAIDSSGSAKGYYVLTRHGGIFEFGEAAWYGSPYNSGYRPNAIDLVAI